MSLKSLINGAAVAAVTTGMLAGAASCAQANEWRRGGHGQHYSGPGVGGGYHDGGRGAWAHRGEWRDHGGSHVGRNVAIGAFAAVLGMALAAESQRVQHEYYDERD